MSVPPKARFAELAIDRPLDGLFTYKIPDGMDLQIGHAVLVPFGRTKATGYVIGLRDTTDFPRTKRISRLLDQTPAFDESMLPFFQWISTIREKCVIQKNTNSYKNLSIQLGISMILH